jgi:sigma-B regulation protein RsbU (phosphoserine phosphatase)
MPTSPFQKHHKQIEAIARAWLAAGALTAGVRVPSGLTAHEWCVGEPSQDTLPTQMLTAAINMGGHGVGEIYVELPPAEYCHHSQMRLNTDAQLITRLFEAEDELTTMTGELVEAHDQLIAIYDLTESARNRISIHELLNALAHVAGRLLGVGSASALAQFNGELIGSHYPLPLLDERDLHVLMQSAHHAGRSITLDGRSNNLIRYSVVENVLVEPITIRGTLQAGLVLVDRAGGFGSPEIKLIHAITQQMGAQMENALLYQESLAQARLQARIHTEMEVAQRVQTRLLPQTTPRVAGLDIFAASRPAREVGGDMFDFVAPLHSQDEIVMFLCDVSGKGMPAALLMAMTRTMLRAKTKSLMASGNCTPRAILADANEDLYDDFTEVGMFVTAFAARYTSKGLVFTSAGHSPVIFCPAGGTPRLFAADAPPLGVLTDYLGFDQHLALQPGDVMVIATDGFVEASSPNGAMFGVERLLGLVQSLAERPAAAIAQALYDAVEQFQGGEPQADDQTVLILKTRS